jgi:hypothetical protein
MKTITIKGIEPVEVLEGIPLHFPDFADEMPGDKRPIVNVYRYRFHDNFGAELSFKDTPGGGHLRFILFEEDSNKIKKASPPSWGHRATLRSIVTTCHRNSKRDFDWIESCKREIDRNT